MAQFTITEVPAYKTLDGSLILAADFLPVTAYRVDPPGEVFEAREDARLSLVASAANLLAEADAAQMAAVVNGEASEDAVRARYAILYLASVIKGEA